MVKKLPVLGMCIPTDDGSKEPKTEIFLPKKSPHRAIDHIDGHRSGNGVSVFEKTLSSKH